MKLFIYPLRRKTASLPAARSSLCIYFSIILILCGFHGYAQLSIGENPGYYGAQYTDQQLYDLMYAAGARSTRSSVPVQYDLTYGMATFQARLQYPYSTKGMRNNTFFLFASPGPTYSTESTKKTAGGHQSWLPAGIYNPAFNADGSIDTTNAWAKYVYDVVQSVGPYFNYWEVWNEPDLTNSSDSYNDSTVSKTSWQITEPTPDELTNMYDSLESYVQLCKIANQVVKKYYPNAKICTGGIGYPWFYQWFLRKGGGQWVDELSFHEYPYYAWCYCAWTGTSCGPAGFHRNSDYAANQNLAELQSFRQIETNEKSLHFPAMMTETNIPRWSYVPSGDMEVFPQNRPWGSDRTQRNFTIKAFTKMLLAGLTSFYFYQTGETGDSGLNNGLAGSEIDAMGMYKNLAKATPGKEVMTSQGKAIQTMQRVMGNYAVDGTQPALPSGVDGVRFDSSGNKLYVIWAVATLDTVETASGSFSLPPGTYRQYLYDGSSPGTLSGTINLVGDPYILVQLPSIQTSVTCNVGSNQTITLPTNTASLTASGSIATNSTISSYAWTQISGPGTDTLAGANSVNATASNLIAGVYAFQVLIKDAAGDSCKSTTQVTVNPALQPPEDNAGSNLTITLPVSSVQLSGTASNGSGTITSYVWAQTSGPGGVQLTGANTLTPTAAGLVAGTYVFQLTVTDVNNLSASSSVTITVNPPNQPPSVNAGFNQNIVLPNSSASLSGSATDATGTITAYSWTEVSGPNQVSFSNSGTSNTNVMGLVLGAYQLKLTVTDNNNLSGWDTVDIVVTAPAPVVSAGTNQTIMLPATSASLQGTATDAGGNITTYTWSEISGPSQVTFTGAVTTQAMANGLVIGTYIFEFSVSDNNNQSDSSTMTVTVIAPSPVVSAGTGQTITLPSNSVTLSGSATDAAGNINSYTWSEYSGPSGATIADPNTTTTSVNFANAGTYVFQLEASDNNDMSGYDTVTVTVKPPNQPPVVNAGPDQIVDMPATSATLSGSATDATGNIVGYTWSQNSGPTTATIGSPNATNTTVGSLALGTYVFV